MELKDIIGYLATVIWTVMMLPQVWKAYVTKSMTDISWVMVIFYILNCMLWLIYGYLIISNPLILCNGIALVIGIVQWVFKYKYMQPSTETK